MSPPKVSHRVNPNRDSIPPEKRTYRWPMHADVVVTAVGEVSDPQIVSPPQPTLDAVALAAVRQWRYEPALRGGKPVAAFLTTTVTFDRRLTRACSGLVRRLRLLTRR